MTFTEILSQCNIEYKTEGHHHCRPGWVQLDCPFCGKDSHKWHLGYSLVNNFLNCWRCGSHPLTKTLMEASGLSFQQCKNLLSDLDKKRPEAERPAGRLTLPKGVTNTLSPTHIRYLKGRGLDPTKLEKLWRIGSIGISSELQWRIFIPIFYHGKMVSWTTRSISDSPTTTRYISASEEQEDIPHKSLLYGEDFARHAIVVCEGPFDAWRIGPGAVATMGVGYSQSQISKMAKYPIRAICFDNEPQAQVRAEKLTDDLSAFDGETYNVKINAKDAAEASGKEIKLLRRFLE